MRGRASEVGACAADRNRGTLVGGHAAASLSRAVTSYPKHGCALTAGADFVHSPVLRPVARLKLGEFLGHEDSKRGAMGHIRLGELPRTRKWSQVVALIRRDGDVADIAAASLDAAASGFRLAADDAGVAWTTWLLTQLPLAAREPNYEQRLAALGVEVSGAPSLIELVAAFTDAVDKHMRRVGKRTDLGEMAQMAAAETLTSILGDRTQSLFGSSPADVQRELAALATTKQFGDLARGYFAGLTRRYLGFFLSRELSNHVGGGRRFANLSEHAEFNAALGLHCRQASRIVEEFAGGWFSKTNWEEGISPENSKRFAATALKKLRSEIERGGRAAS